jgi:hypothetical protein
MLLRPRWCFFKHRALPLRVFDPLAGNLEVFRLALNTNERPPHLYRCYSGCPAPEEWIANRRAIRRKSDAPLHQKLRLLRRVSYPLRVCGSDAPLELAAQHVNACPRQFKVAHARRPIRLEPRQPTTAWRQVVVIPAPNNQVLRLFLHQSKQPGRRRFIVPRFPFVVAGLLAFANNRVCCIANPIGWVGQNQIAPARASAVPLGSLRGTA